MKQYKYVAVDGTEIVFRLLSAEESDRVIQVVSQRNPFVDEYLFNLITDNKYKVNDLLAGIIPTVISISLKVSGVLKTRIDFPKKIDSFRASMDDNAYYILYATIIKAQPSYNLEELKKKTLMEILELFTFSELVIGKQVIDTKKIYQMIDDENKVKPTKGIKSVTPEELEALKIALGSEEGYGGTPPDEWS